MTEKKEQKPFIWKGKPLPTVRDIVGAMTKITSKEEAQEFMATYRAVSPHADSNIGYLTGYLSDKEMTRLLELFQVEHPIFGKRAPTPEESLAIGMKMGAKAKEEEERKRHGASKN